MRNIYGLILIKCLLSIYYLKPVFRYKGTLTWILNDKSIRQCDRKMAKWLLLKDLDNSKMHWNLKLWLLLNFLDPHLLSKNLPIQNFSWKKIKSLLHCVKSFLIWGFTHPYFLAFRLTTKRYGGSPRIQSKYWKIRTRETPNMDTFYAVLMSVCPTT